MPRPLLRAARKARNKRQKRLSAYVSGRVEKRLAPSKRAKSMRKSRGGSSSDAPWRGPSINKIKNYFSIAKYIRGVKSGDWSDAKLEKWFFRKALSSQTLGTGGVLVPPEVSSGFIGLLRAKAVVRGLNPSTYNMKGDTLLIGGQATGATVTWVAEGTDATSVQSQPTFKQNQLVLKEALGLVPIQNSLLRDASPAADDIIKRDLVTACQLAEDLVFIQGAGGTQPLGILNDARISTTILGGGNGAQPTYDDLLDAMSVIELANGTYTGWVFNPRTKNTLRQLKDGAGRYLLELGNLAKGIDDALLGFPVRWTTQIPTNRTCGVGTSCSYGILGNWTEFLIGQKDSIEIVATDVGGDSFKYDQTWVRAIMRVDCIVRQPAEFDIIDGIKV